MQLVRIVVPLLVIAACDPSEAPAPEHGPEDRSETLFATVEIRGQLQELPYEVVGDLAIFDGDIVLGDADEIAAMASGSFRASGSLEVGDAWPDGIVPFMFDGMDATQQANVQVAMDAWERAAAVQFVPWSGGIDYIIFEDDDDDDEKPCHSKVGREGGGQVVHLDKTRCFPGGALHEIGHALGLFHEQGRSDRNDHVTYHEGNTLEEKQEMFEVEVDGIDIGPFAWDSLMLYRSMRFTSNGLPTLTRKNAWTTRQNGGGWVPLRLDESLLLSAVDFGDFDGDGIDEAWRRDGSQFANVQLAAAVPTGTPCDPVTPPLAASWTPLADASPATDWVVAYDFDGDGNDELLGAAGGRWNLANGSAPMAWTEKMQSSVAFESLGFADLTGDGVTDILIADGSAWQLVDASEPTWAPQPFGTHVETGGLRFGFFSSPVPVFNSPVKADVFRIAGGSWLVAFDGVGPWTEINTSAQPLSELRFADLDGDLDGNNLTDVFTAWEELLRVAPGGVGNWIESNSNNNWPNGSLLRVANVDSDAADEVVAQGIFDGQRSCIDEGSAYAVRRLHWGSWEYSSAGTGPWQFLNSSDVKAQDLEFGRFDDDWLVDAFYANGVAWQESEDMTQNWDVLNFSSYGAPETQLGRFPTIAQPDDPLKSDVFVVDGDFWFAYRDGTNLFDVLNFDTTPFEDLALVDMDNDQFTDVFKADGFAWWVSDDAVGGWTFLRKSSVMTDEVAFGYFPSVDLTPNDPEIQDVFIPNGYTWLVSYDGTSDAVLLNISGYTLDSLSLCNFDDNEFTDVFRADGTNWWISRDGIGEWEWLNGSAVTDPVFADVDADGRCDVVTSFDCLNC